MNTQLKTQEVLCFQRADICANQGKRIWPTCTNTHTSQPFSVPHENQEPIAPH